jgi:hypothetical protein
MITEADINAVAARIETVLRDIAVPKPSRIAEQYAALTLSIVLLREQIAGDNTPPERKLVVAKEIDQLLQKRAELEDHFEGETTEDHAGGS